MPVPEVQCRHRLSRHGDSISPIPLYALT